MQSLFFILMSFFIHAEDKNILAGDMSVGGSVSYNYTKSNNYFFFVSPSFQYFVKDHVSVGPVIAHSQSQNSFTYAAGVAGSLYLGENGPTVFRLTQSILYEINQLKGVSWNLKDITATSSIAYLYFLNPVASIGPSIGLRYYLNEDEEPGVIRTDSDTTGFFNISFNIFL